MDQSAAQQHQLAAALRSLKKQYANDQIGVLRLVGSTVCLGEIIRNGVSLPMWSTPRPKQTPYFERTARDTTRLQQTPATRLLIHKINKLVPPPST